MAKLNWWKSREPLKGHEDPGGPAADTVNRATKELLEQWGYDPDGSEFPTPARSADGIPVVASTTERNTRFPTPVNNQRVQNLETGRIERWTGLEWIADGTFGSADSPFLIHRGAQIVNGEQINFPSDFEIGAFVVLNGDTNPPTVELWANAPFQAPYRLAAPLPPTEPDTETPDDNASVNVQVREIAYPRYSRPVTTAITLQLVAPTRPGDTAPVFDAETDTMLLDITDALPTATSLDHIRAGVSGNPLHFNSGTAGDLSIVTGEGVEGGNCIRMRYTPEVITNILSHEFAEVTGPLVWHFWLKTSVGADPSHGSPDTNPFGFKFMRMFRASTYYVQMALAGLRAEDVGNGRGPDVLPPDNGAGHFHFICNDPSPSEGLPFMDPRGADFHASSTMRDPALDATHTRTWDQIRDGEWHEFQVELMSGPLGYEMLWIDGDLVLDSRVDTWKIISDRAFDGYHMLSFPANLVVGVPLGEPGFSLYYDQMRMWSKGTA